MPYIGRTLQVQNRRRNQRIEFRATPEERALIDRAVAAAGTSVAAFVLGSRCPLQQNRSEVVAYYAWCMAAIAVEAAPSRPRKGAGHYPQSVALLARLGVSIHHERRGLGAALLQDVIARTAAVGREIGCRGLLVRAETPQARDFYRHLIPEFEPSPTDELHLILLMKEILRSLGS